MAVCKHQTPNTKHPDKTFEKKPVRAGTRQHKQAFGRTNPDEIRCLSALWAPKCRPNASSCLRFAETPLSSAKRHAIASERRRAVVAVCKHQEHKKISEKGGTLLD